MAKDTGKKLADMMYGQNPEQAAFGFFPHMKPRRSRQDPEAAKNVPVDLARGFVAGTLGMPGDIESLARLPYELITGNESPTILPTSEQIEKRLPFGSDTPAGRAAAGLGALAGGFYIGPGSGARAVTAVPKAVVKAGKDFAVAAGKPASPLTVYHGSPHKFDKFSSKKIGTGEGSQAYGHGLYFAESPEVAKSYQPRSPKYEEKLIKLYQKASSTSNYPMMEVLEDAMMHRTPNEIIQKFTNVDDGYTDKHVKAAQDFAKWYSKNEPEVGGLYTVDLPDEKIARMLDLDRPLSEQSEAVLEAIKKHELDYVPDSLTGDRLIEEMHKAFTPEQVSQHLRNAGIPGVKYFDEASRRAKKGTQNFVVFPGEEDALTILERKKKGGSVHISDNPDVMQLELAKGGLVKGLAKAIGKAAESAGQKAPVLAEKELTTLQDTHTMLGDRVRARAMEAQKQMDEWNYKYSPGQYVFTEHGASKNLPPLRILERARSGNQVMRQDHPEFGPGMGKPIIDPATGKAMRTPYEPGYRVRRQNSPDPEDYAEFIIPEKSIVGDVEFAKGGAVAALKRLVRAPAKTKQEIEAVAERMAPQVTGEYVRAKPGSAVTEAGKTKKQFEREKSLPVDIRATAEERIPQPVDIEKLKGEVMIGIPGDPTVTGKTLYSVGETKLGSPSPQHGGPLYGLYHDDDHFWASGLGAARRVQNLAREAAEQYDAPVVGKYIMMGPDSINYAQHFADANLQAIDLSKMSKKQIEQFNKLIRFGNPNSGPRPSFPGIEDKESAYLHMAMDPELRKHFNELMQKSTITEALNLPSGTDIRFAITEGPLRDLETGVTGYSIGRMKPEISAKELKLSEHPTYSHDIPGEFLGQSKYPIPYELSFPDTLKAIRENPKQTPHEFGSLKMVGPRQIVDQQMIDEIRAYEERMKKLTGKKKGGAVRKAAGGEITADDLILEERKL